MTEQKFTCEGCDAKCCRYVATEIDKPKTKKDYDEILWYLFHENVEVFIEDNDWYIQFNTPCNNLDEESKCKIYKNRPIICKELGNDECEQNGEDDPDSVVFKKPEEFIDYMANKGVIIKNPFE